MTIKISDQINTRMYPETLPAAGQKTDEAVKRVWKTAQAQDDEHYVAEGTRLKGGWGGDFSAAHQKGGSICCTIV